MIGLLALIAGAVAGPIPALVGQIPALVASLSTAAGRLQGLLDRLPGADRFAGLDSLTLPMPLCRTLWRSSGSSPPHTPSSEYRDALHS